VRALRVVLLGTAVFFAAMALWTLVVLLSVRSDLQRARSTLESVRAGDVATDQVASRLAAAEAQLRTAHGRLGQPGPVLFAKLPLVGRTPDAVARSTSATLAVTDGLHEVVVAATEPRSLVQDGAFDTAQLARVSVALDQAAARSRGPLERLSHVKRGLTPGPVHDAAGTAQRELRGLDETFTQTADALTALSGLVGANGPRTVLVVMENNAEQRGTGGIVSVFAVATTSGGRLQLGTFADVDGVAAKPGVGAGPVRVDAPDDFRALWGPYLADTTLWKNVNMSADVPTSSAVLANVAQASTGVRPDAVLWLDVRTIAAIIGGAGDVTLDDGTVLTEQNTVQALLADAYASAGNDLVSQGLREQRLRGAADAVVHRLLDGAPDLVTLAPKLSDAARARHLAVWSAVPSEQAAWEAAGLAGAVRAGTGDLVAMSVNNLGGGDRQGNKLDLYARREQSVTAVVGGSSAAVTRTATLRNTAPQGLPSYVAGGGTPGQTNNLVTFALPRGATDVVLTRQGAVVAATPQPEGDHLVLTDVVSLPAGTETSWRLAYRLPVADGAYDLTVVPQPGAVDGPLTLDLHGAKGFDLAGSLRRTEQVPVAETIETTAHHRGFWRRLGGGLHDFWTEPVKL
jgi:hypothetical protein